MRHVAVTNEMIQRIRDLNDRGYGGKEIAALLGCGKSTVNRYRKNLGLTSEKPGKGKETNKKTIDKILNLSMSRYTQSEIAERTGVSIATVRKYQQINELPASNRNEASGRNVRHEYLKKMTEIHHEEEIKMPAISNSNSECLKVLTATINIEGNKTGFDYAIDLFSGIMKVDVGAETTIDIPFKDIACFANELVAVAEKIESVRKTFKDIQ